jgi:hypothetical protein
MQNTSFIIFVLKMALHVVTWVHLHRLSDKRSMIILAIFKRRKVDHVRAAEFSVHQKSIKFLALVIVEENHAAEETPVPLRSKVSSLEAAS